MFIYKITNIINNKVYIGQTSQSDIRKRWTIHKSTLNLNKHDNSHLQHAWNKYGKQSFNFEIIDQVVFVWSLDILETFWINKYKSRESEYGYNKTSGGHRNKKLSIETKNKISESNKNKTLTAETRFRMSQARIGLKHTPKSIKKMSDSKLGNKNPMFGKTHSLKTCNILSQKNKLLTGSKNSMYGKKHSEEAKIKMRLAKVR